MRPHPLLLATVVTGLAAGCNFELCLDAPVAAESDGSASQPIVGGELDAEHHAVVALTLTRADGRHAVCSGTVIAKRDGVGYVLTAAHCVQGTVDHVYVATDWRDCSPAGDPTKCEASYQPIAWEAHPGYDPSHGYVNDFAIVTFAGATDGTAVTPASSDDDGLVAGSSVTLSGFGRTYAGVDDPSVFQTARHAVDVSVAEVTHEFLRFDAATGRTACFGDSGGPALGGATASRAVVGVASTADETCEHVATYGRVGSVYASFIAPIISPEEGGGGQGGGSGEGGAAGGGSVGGAAAGGGSTGGGDAAGGADSSGGSGGGGAVGNDDDDATVGARCAQAHLSCAASSESSGTGDFAWLLVAVGAMAGMRRRARRA